MNEQTAGSGVGQKKIYVTRTGLPLSFHLDWPFRKSTSGADFFFLHGDIRLENSAGLHAPVAVNLSATVREVMPSLDPTDAENPVINALRKEVDHRQLEFVKSGKLVPVQFSSRHYDFKRNKWMFGKATDEEMALLLTRKAYWQTRLVGGKVWMGDPAEALYVETSSEELLNVAKELEAQGLIKLEAAWATANPSLIEQASKFEADMRAALEELEKKHAFERG
jgi:fructose-specific component phosphotransferase system IIB-like protein